MRTLLPLRAAPMADWDPLGPSQGGAPSKTALHRARMDYRRLCEEPLEGIVAVPDEKWSRGSILQRRSATIVSGLALRRTTE